MKVKTRYNWSTASIDTISGNGHNGHHGAVKTESRQNRRDVWVQYVNESRAKEDEKKSFLQEMFSWVAWGRKRS